MAKYYQPEIQAKREEILGRFYDFKDAPNAVYAVLKRFGRRRKPIYVGETANPRKRFEEHLKVAFGGKEDRSAIGRYERNVIAGGDILEFQCLESCGDRITALAREAAWARALRIEGCDLANAWAEHRPESDRRKVPLKRLMNLSLKEAQFHEVGLQLQCSRCTLELVLPAEALDKKKIGNPTLNRIGGSLTCASCGKPYKVKVNLTDEADSCRVIDVTSVDASALLQSIS